MQLVFLSAAPILDIDGTLLIYLGVFFFLFFFLRAFVFKPMMALFDEREKAIDGAREEARALEREAEDKLVAFETEMAKVRTEAGAERDKLRADATRLERSMTEKVRQETDQLVREAEARMDDEAKRIRAEIASASPDLARQIAEKLLGREVR